MTPVPDRLRIYAARAAQVASEMQTLAHSLNQAADGRISLNEVSLQGAYSARNFCEKVLPMMERY